MSIDTLPLKPLRQLNQRGWRHFTLCSRPPRRPSLFYRFASTVTNQFAAPLAGALNKEFHTFAMDRPGCGLSDRLDYRGTPFREQAVTCIGSLLKMR